MTCFRTVSISSISFAWSVASSRYEATLDAFDDRGDALSAADAQRCEPILPAALAQLVCEREREPRAGRTQRMTEGDRAAVHIRLVAIEAELLLHREVLRRERLVDLDQVHVTDLLTRPIECLTRRRRGTDAHDVGVHAAYTA